MKKRWMAEIFVLSAILILGNGTENSFGKTGRRVSGEEQQEAPRIALTFDDGPSCYTGRLREGLRERGVEAAFFLLGQNMEKYPEEAGKLQKEGHLLGNHSYHHVQLSDLPIETARQEIYSTNALMQKQTGYDPVYLRPPYGAWNKNLEQKTEMLVMMWSVDSLDWKLQNTDRIIRHVLPQIKDGDIILMHDGYETSVEAAFLLIDRLQAQGFRFVRADQLVED